MLRKTAEWQFLNNYYGKYQLAPLILQLRHNSDNRSYYFQYIGNIKAQMRKFI